MPDDKEEKGKDEGEEKATPKVTEEDESVVVDFGAKGEEEEEEGKEEEEEEPAEEKPKEVDFGALLEKAKEEIRGEVAKGPEKKEYTEDELTAAEDKLDQMLEDGELQRSQYRQYMRNIQKLREERREREAWDRYDRRVKKESTEQNIVMWAREKAPDLVNPRTNEYRESVEWAEATIGARKDSDGNWTIPAKVGPVMFGVLYRGQKGTDVKEAEKKGYEKGVKESRERKDELRARDTKVPKSEAKADRTAPATAQEREVMERLGIKNLSRYRMMKQGKGEGVVEVKG